MLLNKHRYARQLSENPATLREFLADFFDLEEIKTLCQDLEVDFEELGGQGKKGKARELVEFLKRHSRLNDLAVALEKRRPQAWQERKSSKLPAGIEPVPLPVEKPPVPPSVPPQEKRRGFGFVVWWGSLSDGTKVAYVGVFGSLLVALIGLVGTLGAPVITEWAKPVFVRPTAIAMATATLTPTVIPTVTSAPTLTPTPIATGTPTLTFTPILAPVPSPMVGITVTLRGQSLPIECGGIVPLPSSGVILIMADIPITSDQERELHWSALVGKMRPQEGRTAAYFQDPNALKPDVVSLERNGVRICYFHVVVQQTP